MCEPRRGASRETKFVNTFIFDFQSLEQREKMSVG